MSINLFLSILSEILSEGDYAGIVEWTHDGDSFRILDRRAFIQDVLPAHFDAKFCKTFCSLEGFINQMTLFGFQRFSDEESKYCFYKNGFNRDSLPSPKSMYQEPLFYERTRSPRVFKPRSLLESAILGHATMHHRTTAARFSPISHCRTNEELLEDL